MLSEVTGQSKIHLLLIEDNPADADRLQALLQNIERYGLPETVFRVQLFATPADSLAYLQHHHNNVDAALLALNPPAERSMEQLANFQQHAPHLPIIVLTNSATDHLATRIMHNGAQDYLAKEHLTFHTLNRAIQQAIHRQALRRELHQKTAKLESSETQLRQIIEQNSDSILVVSQDGVTRFANPAAKKLLESSADQLQEQDFGQLAATNQPVELTILHRRQKQKDIIVEMRVTNIEWGGEACYMATLHDVTQQKKIEQALRRSENQYRTLVENSLQAICIIQEGKIVFTNPILAEIFEYKVTDLLGLLPSHVRDLIHPEDRTLKPIQELLYARQSPNSATPQQFECRCLTRHNQTKWLEVRTRRITHQEQPAMLAVILDITERKQAAKRLTKERNLLRTLIDNMPDEVFVKNLYGCFVIVNLATMRRLEIKHPGEIIGKTSYHFYGPQVAAQIAAEEERLLRTGRPLINKEEQYYNADNQVTTWFLTTKVPLRNQQGQITGLVGIRRDISDRRRAKDALKQEHLLLAQRVNERTEALCQANERLTHALQVKDEFLASMSHELRTPLNAILGMSEILQDEVYGSLNEHQRNSVNIVHESGRHLLLLINDILDLARIEADKLELEPKPIYISQVCQASLRFVQQAAIKKKLDISESYSHDNIMMLADERRLKQILVNLLSNAVKFTPKEGKVGLEVLADEAAQTITFTVWDTGIGIAQEDMADLFEPFVQLDSRLAREYEGSGLGLALVNLLAEMHNATITVDSNVESGSRFMVTFPWQQPAPIPEEVDAAAPSTTSLPPPLADEKTSPTLLLAEDNAANVEVISSYLSAMGYKIITAVNGLQAVNYAHKFQPHLILMDINLPEITGLEATQRIRQESSLNHIPIIALTALAMPGDKERCLAAGMNEYLAKPVSLQQLNITIRRYLGQS